VGHMRWHLYGIGYGAEAMEETFGAAAATVVLVVW